MPSRASASSVFAARDCSAAGAARLPRRSFTRPSSARIWRGAGASPSARLTKPARGPMRSAAEAPATVLIDDYAQDPNETEALLRFRRLPAQKRRIALQILEVLAG